MIKTVLAAVWIAVVSVGSSTGASYWLNTRAKHADKAEPAHVVEQRKTRIINVPIIANGIVQGYVVAQFLYTADSATLKAMSTPPDAYILDEAFRMIYGEEKLDFRKLQKTDLGKMAGELKERVAKRINSDVVKEILLGDFNYVSKDDIRR